MAGEETKDFLETMEIVKYLAEHDPQSLSIVKASLEMLKARCDFANFKQSLAQNNS